MLRNTIDKYNHELDEINMSPTPDFCSFNKSKIEVWNDISKASDHEVELITWRTIEQVQRVLSNSNYI